MSEGRGVRSESGGGDGVRRTVAYPELGETLVEARFPAASGGAGLHIQVLPKPAYRRALAMAGVRYGSVVDRYRVNGDRYEVPAGTAHFLEHCLFEKQGGNLFDRFAELGADVNAYTTHPCTAYHFETEAGSGEEGGAFDRALDLLLELVLVPWFTAKAVDKERSIISQEIRMGRDSAGWRGYTGMLSALYREHPVRIEIAGDLESIARVDAELLARIHGHFYRPDNMVLAVAGRVDADRVIERTRSFCERLQRDADAGAGPGPRVDAVAEPPEPGLSEVEVRLDVAVPSVYLGIKDTMCGTPAHGLCGTPAPGRPASATGEALQRKHAAVNLALEAVLGPGSPLHSRLYEEGIIDSTFGARYEGRQDHAYTLFYGETARPREFAGRIREALAQAAARGLDDDDVARIRRKHHGLYLKALDSLEACTWGLMFSAFQGVEFLRGPAVLAGITTEQASDALRDHLDPAYSTACYVLPKT